VFSESLGADLVFRGDRSRPRGYPGRGSDWRIAAPSEPRP